MDEIDLADKLDRFDTRRQPHVVAGCSEKVGGDFPWHDHPETDDLFLSLSGRVTDRPTGLAPGELFVIPAGARHRLRAKADAHLMLVEPAGTPDTGEPATAVTKPRI